MLSPTVSTSAWFLLITHYASDIFSFTFQSNVLVWELMIYFAMLQSLLAALGSIQFVSNIAFAYFVLNKTISVKYVCFSLSGN